MRPGGHSAAVGGAAAMGSGGGGEEGLLREPLLGDVGEGSSEGWGEDEVVSGGDGGVEEGGDVVGAAEAEGEAEAEAEAEAVGSGWDWGEVGLRVGAWCVGARRWWGAASERYDLEGGWARAGMWAGVAGAGVGVAGPFVLYGRSMLAGSPPWAHWAPMRGPGARQVFCEADRYGVWNRQPALAHSGAGFVVVGVAVLCLAVRDAWMARSRGDGEVAQLLRMKPLTHLTAFPLFGFGYGLLCLGLGVATYVFFASLSLAGQRLYFACALGLPTLVLMHALRRLCSPEGIVGDLGTLNMACLAAWLGQALPGLLSGDALGAITRPMLVASYVVARLFWWADTKRAEHQIRVAEAGALHRLVIPGDVNALTLALCLLALGELARTFDRERWLCAPHSLAQPAALGNLLYAAAAASLYVFWRSDVIV